MYAKLAATLAASLDLQQPPVALSFTADPPAGYRSRIGKHDE
jgi:hypothetical protein